MENKKVKAKNITKPIKTKYKKDSESIIDIFLKMRKLQKEIMRTLEIKICQMQIEKEKKNIWKIIEYLKKLVEIYMYEKTCWII